MTLVLWNRHLAGPWSASDFRLQRYDNNSQVSSKLPNLIKSKKCFGNNYYIYLFVNSFAKLVIFTKEL